MSTEKPDTSQGCPALLSAGHPSLYRQNAFRVSGLPVESGPREISRHLDRLRMSRKFGAAAAERSPLKLVPPPDEHALRNALHKLNDPEKRLIDEFFWFWPHQLGHSKDDEVLGLLADGRIDEASRRWMRMEMDSESLVSMHNLAVLYHCLALDIEASALTRRLTKEETAQGEEYWDLAFKRWKNVLEREPFWSRLSARIRALDDPRLTTGLARRMRDCLPLALLSINADLAKTFAEAGQLESAKRQIAIMALWDSTGAAAAGEDKKDRKKSGAPKITGGVALTALERSLETIRQRIKTICKTEEAKSDADATQGLEAASGLLDKAVPLLKILDTLLPAGDTTREAAADEVALTALRCEISFGNKTERWKEALELLEKVKPIAATNGLKTRIQDNIDIVKTNLVYGTCWFCQENPADKNAALEVKMYGDVVRTPTWQGTRVQWRHGSVTVPRCETCKKAHARREGWQAAGAIIGLVLGIGSCLGVGADKGGWLLTPLLLGVGAGLGSLIGKIGSPPGLRPQTDHKTFPSVQKLIDQGWTFGAGPAQ